MNGNLKNKGINNLTPHVGMVLDNKRQLDNLMKLDNKKVNQMFFKKGVEYREKFHSLDDVYDEINESIMKYVNQGYDENSLLLYVKRGFECSDADNPKRRVKRY